MRAVYALFDDPDSAQMAVDNLRAAGVADPEITVISSEPFEEYDFSHRDKATWIFWIAAAAGGAGLAFGYWLTSMTERSWPLPTGGMPIVAFWPNLVIMFELTMLFAIVATVITLLISARIPRRRPRLYDADVSTGRILVGLEDTGVSIEALERALVVRDGMTIKTIAEDHDQR